MAITLKRQLTSDEKDHILAQHGRRCWATGMDIPEDQPIHFDHIRAFSREGESELANIAPMSAECNRMKGTLALEDYRVKLRLQKFFAGGDRLTLGDLLRHLHAEDDIDGFGADVNVTEADGRVHVRWIGADHSYEAYTCPATGWKYFYATLPIAVLDSDDDRDAEVGLQPRYLIFDKVFDMFRHFQRHPVLQPSIGRVLSNKVRLFDGQHKIAGLLWAGRRDFECKVYLNPDIRLLNQTNIQAHDKFAQTRFFSSIMVMKLGTQFGADFEEYKNQEDGEPKSENGFMQWLERREGGITKGELRKRFQSYLYNAVIEHDDNRMTPFISASNRSSDEKPITIDQLGKSLFSNFLYRWPMDDNMTTDDYKRDAEAANMVALMNMFHDLALHAWNPKVGPHDETQRRLGRLFRSKAAMAWSEILKDAACGKLDLLDRDDRQTPLYRELDEEQMQRLGQVVSRLVSWKWWAAPANDEIDRVLSDNKSAVKDWLKSKGLTPGYLMGASE
ncbi:HNH endonuclease signature motif containing protein [Verrucomicrobiota bacterium]